MKVRIMSVLNNLRTYYFLCGRLGGGGGGLPVRSFMESEGLMVGCFSMRTVLSVRCH